MARFSDLPEEVLVSTFAMQRTNCCPIPFCILRAFGPLVARKCQKTVWKEFICSAWPAPTLAALMTAFLVFLKILRRLQYISSEPALRELKAVPDARFGDGYEIRGVGFGYDFRADDIIKLLPSSLKTRLNPVLVKLSSGDEDSCYWTRHLIIGPLVGIHQPVVFWDNVNLFMEDKDQEIISYNIDTKKFSGPSICMEWLSNCFVICETSLVSVLKQKSGQARLQRD
ncbi:hypothetical protein TIFTF001_013138 [Ficus carica]|uniref:Uncharacterized protein n=1 Tax=Ficus carica TaxID=3494 RepID=A0AA88D6Y5_FICCA|nr:hypothetical protein TIFTF001_013138 [Ficus carica]